MHDFDLFVIGAGSGGVAAGRRASLHGARVGICEVGRVGGTCVNRGCIPKKLLMYAAHYGEDFREAQGYGWSESASVFSWVDLIAAKDREIQRLNQVYEGMLEQGRVALLRGRARMLDAHTIDVDGTEVRAEHVLLANGGHPFVPDIPGKELGFTSDEAFHLPSMPERVMIVGGGYIALEFASIFRGIGAAVTIVHRSDLLHGFDDDVRAHITEELRKRDIALRPARTVRRLGRKGTSILATLDDNEVLAADGVLFATGRRANTADLGLEAAGVALDARGAVAVDDDSRTSAANIFAIGDLTHRRNLTPVAIAEGRAVADRLYGGGGRRLDYTLVPTAVFSLPAVAAVGLTEAQARARFAQVDIYKSGFRPLRHTLSGSDERALVKLVVDGATDRVLGAHMVGADAPEIVQGLAVALTAGVTKAQVDATVAIHPTAAEEFVLLRTKSAAKPA